MSSLWCCPSSTSSANHCIAHLKRCPEEWFWINLRLSNHVSFCLLTVARRSPVGPQGNWFCSAPSHQSCAPSRRCGGVSWGIYTEYLDKVRYSTQDNVLANFWQTEWTNNFTRLLCWTKKGKTAAEMTARARPTATTILTPSPSEKQNVKFVSKENGRHRGRRLVYLRW